jgi:hypothetical protein
MNSVQSTISSPRNQRILFWIGLLVLAAGIVVLVMKLAGGSDPTPVSPDKGFQAQIPPKTNPLVNADGVKVTKYEQLDPEIETTIRRFVLGAVAGKNYADSWNVIAPAIKRGYTAKTWATASSHPIIPFPVYGYDNSKFTLTEATTKEIMVDIRMAATAASGQHTTTFTVALVPTGKSGQRWMVSYWGPRYGPPVPIGTDQ